MMPGHFEGGGNERKTTKVINVEVPEEPEQDPKAEQKPVVATTPAQNNA